MIKLVAKLDRTGEVGYNNFGSKMVIKEYRTNRDIDIYFPEYNWTIKHTYYQSFKNGQIKCPYEKRVYGVGYIGEGKYRMSENGKQTKCYKTWIHMLERCYDEKAIKKRPRYEDCEVCNEWLCYQNFAEWYYKNYYEIKDEIMCLDKDILHKGNKIYSPDTCAFVPEKINTLFTKRNNARGDYPIGVSYDKVSGKFIAQCHIYDFKNYKSKIKHLGYYNTSQKAFNVYKEFKEKNIKKVAEHYKEQIPYELYQAMHNYRVEIND